MSRYTAQTPGWRVELSGPIDRDMLKVTIPGCYADYSGMTVRVPSNAIQVFRTFIRDFGYLAESDPVRIVKEVPPPKRAIPAMPAWYQEGVDKVRNGIPMAGFGPSGHQRILPLDFQLRGAGELVQHGARIFHWPTGSGKTVGAELCIWRTGASRIVWTCPVQVLHQTAAHIRSYTGISPFIWEPPSKRRKSWVELSTYCDQQEAAGQPRIFLFGMDNVAEAILDTEKLRPSEDVDLRPKRRVLRFNQEFMRFSAKRPGDGPMMLIVDEVHLLGSHKRVSAIHTGELDEDGEEILEFEPRDNEAAAFKHLTAAPCFDYRLGMTATDIPDRQRQMYAIYDSIFPGCFGLSYWDFAKRYCGARQNEWGGLSDSSNTNTEELAARKRTMTHRPSLEEVQAQMPAKRYTMRFIPQEAQVQAPTCAKDAQAFQRIKNLAKSSRDGQLSLDLLRAALRCVRELHQDVRTHVALGHKVLVLTRHHVAINAIDRHFREKGLEPFSVVTGESVQGDERHRIVRSFEDAPGGGVLLGTGGVLGTGVDFTKVSYLAIAELPYTPLEIIQWSGRGGRIGGVPCEVAFYVAERTRAERVQAILLSKLPAAQAMVGDGELDDMARTLTAAGDDDALLESFFGNLSEDTFTDDDRS